MKNHFINLIRYDKYANTLTLDLIQKAQATEQIIKTMAHLLAAQRVWLIRCSGGSETTPAIWPDWPMDTFAGLIEQNSEGWLNYLDSLKPANFDNIIAYRTSRGDLFENKTIDIITHMINHGTHHRAQIGQYLKQQGVDLPIMDYIIYVRSIS